MSKLAKLSKLFGTISMRVSTNVPMRCSICWTACARLGARNRRWKSALSQHLKENIAACTMRWTISLRVRVRSRRWRSGAGKRRSDWRLWRRLCRSRANVRSGCSGSTRHRACGRLPPNWRTGAWCIIRIRHRETSP